MADLDSYRRSVGKPIKLIEQIDELSFQYGAELTPPNKRVRLDAQFDLLGRCFADVASRNSAARSPDHWL
jgi:hypothetical protein